MAKFKSYRIIQLLLVVILASSSISMLPVGAVTESELKAQGIYFYNPDDPGVIVNQCEDVVNYSVDILKSEQLEHIFTLLLDGGFNAGQASAIMGNFYAESGFNSDAHEAGNDIGYGLAQWSFGRRDNLEAFAAEKGVDVSNIDLQIEFLLQEYNSTYKTLLTGTGFEEGIDLSQSTEDWMKLYEAPLEEPVEDPARLHSKRIPAAQKIYKYYSSLSPDSPKAYGGCYYGGLTVIANKLIESALSMAIPYQIDDGVVNISQVQESDRTEILYYKSVMEQYNISGTMASCDHFIAAIMKESGVDPSYPDGNVGTQYDYVTSRPSKYLVIENPSISDLQPGDILILSKIDGGVYKGQHTTIHLGYNNGTGYPNADASHNTRLPSLRSAGNHNYMFNSAAASNMVLHIVRVIANE